jgi:hypothetical protein
VAAPLGPRSSPGNCSTSGSYDGRASAVLTLRELQRWLALAVTCYHGEVHEPLGCGLGREGRRVRDAGDVLRGPAVAAAGLAAAVVVACAVIMLRSVLLGGGDPRSPFVRFMPLTCLLTGRPPGDYLPPGPLPIPPATRHMVAFVNYRPDLPV